MPARVCGGLYPWCLHIGCSRSSRCLGRPSVGGRLTAGAARREGQSHTWPRGERRKHYRLAPCQRTSAVFAIVAGSAYCRSKVLRTSPSIAQTRTMNTVLFVAAAEVRRLPSALRCVALVTVQAPAPNPSTRTSRCVNSGDLNIWLFRQAGRSCGRSDQQRTDCTSTNGLVAPRRARTQIRTAQPGSIPSLCLGADAFTQG